MRFHLRELLTVVAISGLVCAALVQGGRLWETIVFSGTLLLVLGAALLAIGRTAGARRFWLGFAVAAGSYVAFAHLADEHDCVPRRDAPEVTSRLLFWGVTTLNYDMSVELIRHGDVGGAMGSVPTYLNPQFRIGHCAWALLFGWLAGHLLSTLHVRSQSTV